MPEPTDLVADQAHRFAAVDPLLPTSIAVPEGRTLVATVADGGRVTGVVRTAADGAWELTPLVGARGWVGMDAVLRACRDRMNHGAPGPEPECRVVWPSRDAECTRPLLDHGFVPVSALAVRTRAPGAATVPDAGVPVRWARDADLDVVHDLRAEEAAFSLRFLTVDHPDRRGSPPRPSRPHVWVAEDDDRIVGMVEDSHVTVGPDRPDGDDVATDGGALLPEGRWGFLHAMVVRRPWRGRGVGRALAAAVHAHLDTAGTRGTCLYYSPLNPLSSVFWHRQGYRPLWTVWESRPSEWLG